MAAEGRVAVTGGDEFADQGVEGFGQHDGFAAEPELHLVLVGVDVIEREAADRGRPLRVEQDEKPRDAVAGVDVGLVHQPAGLGPTRLGVDGAGGAVPSDGGELELGDLLAFGPAHEVSGFVAMLAVLTGQPGVKVTLAGVGQGVAVAGEPVHQRNRSSHVLLDDGGLAVGGVAAVVAPAQPVQQVPDRVVAQQGSLVGVVVFGEGSGDPLFETDQVLVKGELWFPRNRGGFLYAASRLRAAVS